MKTNRFKSKAIKAKRRLGKKFKNQRGFAIALALLMLVVMSLMGATLLVVVAGDHKRNSNQDVNQQAFYAAESGLSDARVWLSKETPLTPTSATSVPSFSA